MPMSPLQIAETLAAMRATHPEPGWTQTVDAFADAMNLTGHSRHAFRALAEAKDETA